MDTESVQAGAADFFFFFLKGRRAGERGGSGAAAAARRFARTNTLTSVTPRPRHGKVCRGQRGGTLADTLTITNAFIFLLLLLLPPPLQLLPQPETPSSRNGRNISCGPELGNNEVKLRKMEQKRVGFF